MLLAARRHQLHADADAEERPRLDAHRFGHRFQHAVHRVEAPAAIGEGADAGQHDAIGAVHGFGIARHHDLLRILHAPRGKLERFRRRVKIAGAVIDDRNAHRGPPGSGNRPMIPPCGIGGGGLENGWPGMWRVGGGPPRSTAHWSLVSPRCRAVQRSKKRCSAASSSSATTMSSWRHFRRDKRPAPQAGRFEAHQDGDQDVDGEDRAAAGAERRHPELDGDHQNDPADQHQPQPMPQQPDHARDRGPEMEAVTDKDEFVGRREIGAVGYGSMHCVDRHRTSPPRPKKQQGISRRADPWWKALRPPRSDRSRPRHEAPSPDP